MKKKQSRSQRAPVRRINFRVLLGTMIVVGISFPAIWFLHSFQIREVASSMLDRIEALRDEENWKDAAEYTERYLLLRPEDGEKRIALAELYDKSATSLPQIQRSIALQLVAIGVCESQEQFRDRVLPLRRTMIDRLMQVDRMEDALDQIGSAAKDELDPLLQKSFALCRFQLATQKRTHRLSASSQSQLPQWLSAIESMHVVDLIAKSLVDLPGDLELSLAMAQACLGDPALLRGSQIATETIKDLEARAVATADRMLAAHREDPMAWLAHYEVLSRVDRIAAESDIRQALALAPEDARVQKQAGLHYLERGRGEAESSPKRKEWLTQADGLLRSAKRKGFEQDTELYIGLGELLVELQREEEGLEVWNDGVRLVPPPTANLHFRIVGTLLRQRKFPEAAEALRTMDESIRREGPSLPATFQSSIARAGKQQWATYYVAKGEFRSAIQLMEQVVAGNRDLEATDQAEAWAFLGGAYFEMEQYDRAATAFEQAVALLPTKDQYHRGVAASWFAALRFREAIRQLQAINSKSASDWLQIAECCLEIQRRQRQEDSLWGIFDDAVLNVARQLPNDALWQTKPWLAELLSLDGAVERASGDMRKEVRENSAKRLIELCRKPDASDELRRRTIQRLKSWGQDSLATELVEEMRAKAETSTEAALTQAEILMQQGFRDEAEKLLQKRLTAEPDNKMLLRAISQIRTSRTDLRETNEELSKVSGDSLSKLRALCEVALNTPVVTSESELQDNDIVNNRLKEWSENVVRYENLLKSQEGDAGTEWRYVKARRLLTIQSLKEDLDLAEVADIAGYLDRQRPQWVGTHTLIGSLADRQKNSTRAIRAFTRAIQLGAQDLKLFERLAELLYGQGMLAEAAALIDRLGERSNQSRRLSSLAISLANSNEEDAVSVARAGVEARASDPMAWVWLAQVLESASRGLSPDERAASNEESRQAFEKAKQLGGVADTRVLNAEFAFYFATGQSKQIEGLIDSLTTMEGLTDAVRWTTLAEFNSSLNKLDDAARAYRKALEFGANPIDIGNRLARLLLSQGRQDEAIAQMQAVYKEFPNDNDSRRILATMLASRGTEKDWETIGSLLADSSLSSTADDKRLQAELLAQRGKPSDLAKAQYLLEGLVEDINNRTDEDRFRLASIYIRSAKLLTPQEDGSGQASKLLEAAGRQLKLAASGGQTPPEYVYAYADFLMEMERFGEAKEQLERLTILAPDEFATALLKARLFKQEEKSKDAQKVVEDWLKVKRATLPPNHAASQEAELYMQAGQAMSVIGLDKKAEELLRSAYELDSRAGREYVTSLSRSNDKVARRNAIDFLISRVKKTKASEAAQLLAYLLSIGEVDPELLSNAEMLLAEVEASNDSDIDLLLTVADLWLARNRQKQAIETYRRIIRLRPNDIIALNNLANLLAEQQGAETEALEYVEQAMRIAGRQPLLLDTKGVILLSLKKTDEAISVLEIAAAGSDDPRLAFHLYQAFRSAARTQEADRVLNSINLSDLQNSLLTPADRKELESILKK